MDAQQSEFSLQLSPDRFPTCQHCGITFVWTGWEQQLDVREPEHCPGCRFLLTSTHRWGVVKWYDARKGFGFITRVDGSDVFVRRRDIKGSGKLRKGQLVKFRLKEGKSGLRAVQVRIQNQLDADR